MGWSGAEVCECNVRKAEGMQCTPRVERLRTCSRAGVYLSIAEAKKHTIRIPSVDFLTLVNGTEGGICEE